VVQYIKTFSDRFDKEGQPDGLKIGDVPAATATTYAEGERLYEEMRCFLCHGKEGRGDGPITTTLVYEWGFPFRARNLTKGWTFKRGNAPADIYRTIFTGLNGTPMGSYAGHLSEEERWSMAHYVASLSRDRETGFDVVIRSKLLKDDLPEKPDDPRWEAAKWTEIPLGAQIVVTPPSRWWTPTANSVAVKSLYNGDEIAFRLEWDDPTNMQDEVFRDAVAIKFPNESEEGPEKPYFIAEGSPKALGISRWEATAESEAENREEEPDQNNGGLWKNGRWSVVIKRTVPTEDFTLTSFSVGDGSNRERGAVKAISTWYYLQLEKPTPVRVYVYVVIAILAAIGVEWGAIRRLRRKLLVGGKAVPVQR
jgi:DMSO reductase family type II enzyme heme b subunit